jgi:hypothetical protein
MPNEFETELAAITAENKTLFGEAIVYTPSGGSPLSLTGIISDRSIRREDNEQHGLCDVHRLTLQISQADVAVPALKDSLTLEDRTWAVEDEGIQTAGSGGLHLLRFVWYARVGVGSRNHGIQL